LGNRAFYRALHGTAVFDCDTCWYWNWCCVTRQMLCTAVQVLTVCLIPHTRPEYRTWNEMVFCVFFVVHLAECPFRRSAHTLCLCVLCGSENKQPLFSYTALNYCLLYSKQRGFTARYELNLQLTQM
jgi:hypothetical protein